MERAFERGDAAYDGIFYVAVRTTGIFCKPSCPARKPLPRNREYYPTTTDALRAGYRPCKRCAPFATNGQPPAWVRPLMRELERRPHERLTDTHLRALGIEPARARRYFIRTYGMTFQAFSRRRRMAAALEKLKNGSKLDSVIFGHGYDSTSGFREAFAKAFGKPPSQGRDTDHVTLGWTESPVGPLLLGAVDEGLCVLEFCDQGRLDSQLKTVRQRLDRAAVPGGHRYLDQIKEELSRYFAGKLREFRVPLVYPGTPFQRKVWEGLLTIPYGETISYEQLAERVGAPGAQRAVGAANGRNRIAIVIPCHRVVNKSGQLGGYGGGLWRKQLLLDLERGVKSGRPQGTLFDRVPI
jgi:AraC family transcriptional regulator of adaptative response/methylated-DNA-[protein]-cysteine methyltransferase